jgi:hypothetical protein
MGIEMDETDRPDAARQCPHERQRHAVFAAQRDQMADRGGLLLNQPQALRMSRAISHRFRRPASVRDRSLRMIASPARLACRIAGTEPAPLRLVVPISNGMPAM